MSESLPKDVYGTFAGIINHESAHRFMHNVDAAVAGSVERFHILLQSSGGIVEDGIALYNFLTNVPLTVIVYNVGVVQSIAVTVYLAGKIRKCSANASFMIHKSTLNLPPNVTIETLRERTLYLELSDKNVEAVLRSHITMPDDKWAIHGKGDLLFTPDEAKVYGLVHEIADFTPPPGSKMFAI